MTAEKKGGVQPPFLIPSSPKVGTAVVGNVVTNLVAGESSLVQGSATQST
jgi:hypothetical protein